MRKNDDRAARLDRSCRQRCRHARGRSVVQRPASPTELGHIGTDNSGFTNNYASAVNAAGTVGGAAIVFTGNVSSGARAVRWDAGSTTATELGNLSKSTIGVAFNDAQAINSAGTAVGHAEKYKSDGTYLGVRAVRWDAGGTIATELGNIGLNPVGIGYSRAFAINSAGVAVGMADEWNPVFTDNRAVYWDLDGVAVDLNTLLSPEDAMKWTLSSAKNISDTGWVTGTGLFDPDGPSGSLPAYDRMFLIQIPTPGAAAALVLAGLVITKRRRR